jgi:hypothetical protein
MRMMMMIVHLSLIDRWSIEVDSAVKDERRQFWGQESAFSSLLLHSFFKIVSDGNAKEHFASHCEAPPVQTQRTSLLYHLDCNFRRVDFHFCGSPIICVAK